METYFIFTLALTIFISLLLKPILSLLLNTKKLPPGPVTLPIIGSFLWLWKSFWQLEPLIRKLQSQYGPIITLHIGSCPAIFISNHSLAHQALIQNGAVFADRPPTMATNQLTISAAGYGPTWRRLRRNLTVKILHPSCVKAYGGARKWVLNILASRLKDRESEGIRVVDHFRYSMFCLLVLMCFGDKLDETQIKQIEQVQRRLLLSFSRLHLLNLWPSFTKIVLKKWWAELFQFRKDQENVLLPLIRARKEAKLSNGDDFVLAYVDTLLDLQLPDEKRNLTEYEVISLCSEFLNSGTDTTSTALQWIMANIVKYPTIQERLFEEIQGVVEETTEEVKDEDLQKMPYLKAVVLECLRRHPPSHFVLPHSVTHDVVLDSHVVPKNGIVNFMVADMGWDAQVWKDPMDFKPERFLNAGDQGFDLTGTREIKMMPFGVGRRICPAASLAVLHLEYFVANLVWTFEWRAVEGDEIDLSEKQEFTMVMKNPLKANISPRVNK
ncbi:hypothetical protein M0R45_016601 [Rubus argutus]|uniref:Cytochrome P450 n=1 Tax=Rubus argutus TaxID=59490 RepID=A0AAW1XU22_RUBAR